MIRAHKGVWLFDPLRLASDLFVKIGIFAPLPDGSGIDIHFPSQCAHPNVRALGSYGNCLPPSIKLSGRTLFIALLVQQLTDKLDKLRPWRIVPEFATLQKVMRDSAYQSS